MTPVLLMDLRTGIGSFQIGAPCGDVLPPTSNPGEVNKASRTCNH